MNGADSGNAWLLEICPASTLRRLGSGRLPYKGGKQENRAALKQVLDRLIRRRAVAADIDLIKRAIDDPGGDALDGIVAAYAVYDTISHGRLVPGDADDEVEGFVYF